MNLCVGIQTPELRAGSQVLDICLPQGIRHRRMLAGRSNSTLSQTHMHAHTHLFSLSLSFSSTSTSIQSATIPDSTPICTLFVFTLLQHLSLADTDVGLFIKVRQQEIPGIFRGRGTHWRGKMRPSLPCRDPCYVALHWQPKACSLWSQTIQTQPLKSPQIYQLVNPHLTQTFQSQKRTRVTLRVWRHRERERERERERHRERETQSSV